MFHLFYHNLYHFFQELSLLVPPSKIPTNNKSELFLIYSSATPSSKTIPSIWPFFKANKANVLFWKGTTVDPEIFLAVFSFDLLQTLPLKLDKGM